ncbi:MAG TPA: hypothetical protein VFV76_07260 [Actinomycetes bacterium]|nr:hypothetical protein [Actinomycetes bacterium]
MGWRTRDDRGLVATEAGLLYGGVALIFVPVLFLLGTVVHDVFDNAGKNLPGGSGSAQQPGPDPGDPAVVATARLESEVRSAPGYAGATVNCTTLPTAEPPTSTDCKVVTSSGEEKQITVTWNADGTYTVPPA